MEKLLTINDDEFSSEVIDREVIVINFNTGSYYSLRGVAACVWEWMRRPVFRSEVTEAVRENFADAAAGFEEDIDAFLAKLSDEGLIVALPASRRNGGPPALRFAEEYCDSYAPPVLDAYTDMQELIVLDAIQE